MHDQFIAPLPVHLADHLWANVSKGNGCWEWTGNRNNSGYGRLYVRGTKAVWVYAHRLSWIIAFGPIPDGLYVCHHCDNPPCVRPDHLFLGTAKDNYLDALAKGRCYGRPAQPSLPKPRGRRPYVLSEAVVSDIRAAYRPRVVTLAKLAKQHRVSIGTIWRALFLPRHVA